MVFSALQQVIKRSVTKCVNPEVKRRCWRRSVKSVPLVPIAHSTLIWVINRKVIVEARD